MMDNPGRGVTLSEIAWHVGSSPSHLSRLFRGSTGRTPKQVLTLIRMERAAELLRETELSPKEITAAVGMSWVGSFGRAFKAWHGVSPARYRVLHGRNERNCEIKGRNCERLALPGLSDRDHN
jgi:transcriptional regulator GlxA family with amidase domain